MTAPSARSRENASGSTLVGQTCQTAIDGRRAVRILGGWSEQLQLTEPELQILWCLRDATGQGVDQTTLATRLAFSPAQVSACVEKLRGRGLIAHHEAPGDRRRRLWQLSTEGNEALPRIVQVAGEAAAVAPREAAA